MDRRKPSMERRLPASPPNAGSPSLDILLELSELPPLLPLPPAREPIPDIPWGTEQRSPPTMDASNPWGNSPAPAPFPAPAPAPS